ncbi:LysR family transcriptional regulator [Acidovorax cavernicola]|uniref:LysR family transcriptional regulator n=1 Tax=Acidovorax cavernicola TaxID=1675792 RepID=A0A9X8GV34_9BURK|nr:LysR family transcriptional regulator [Acidovorax cavernicola]RIX79828.1 LysR family transcriptional regulator [Acidovorax cavernicola]
MNPDLQFDWRLVRSFLAALDHGSLLGAARKLGASQPTLGRHIAELEAQLGVVLFERTGQGLRPTAMATRLAEAARTMESGALALSRSVSGANTAMAGSVRISASQATARQMLPSLLVRMRQELPDIQVDLVSTNEISNLLRREADIAIRMSQPTTASVVARRIGTFALGAFAHSDYLRRRGMPRQTSDLLRHDVLGYDSIDTIIRMSAQLGTPLQREDFCFRTDDMGAYWEALRQGMGIGFVSESLAHSDTGVVRVLPQLKIQSLPVWLAVHREIRTDRRIRAVYDFLVRNIPAMI